MKVTFSFWQKEPGVVSIETGLAWDTVLVELQKEPMTSLLPSVLYETEGRAPAPSKDFHHLAITKTEVRHQ